MDKEPILTVNEGPETVDSSTVVPRSPDKTVLEQLTDMVSSEVVLPDIEIAVRERKGVSVQYSPNVTSADLRMWRKKATNRKTQELDNVKFSCYVVAATAVAILVGDEVAIDSDGNPVVFNSSTFADMMNVDMSQIVPQGVQMFFGVDAHLETTALTILDRAGYGDEIDAEEDPTSGS